jgi:ppGpp synthetase/RelA/SpoT-type nucleotidyltranferase
MPKKPDKAQARTVFDRNEPIYKRLAEEVEFILEHELAKAALKYHSVVSRVKKFDSFWSKAQRKDMENPFTMTDIVGVRVVCLFLSELKKVGAVIKECFHVLSEDDKIEGQDAASFGYMSLHYDVSLKKTYSGARYDQLVGLACEIQVRTIAMDAWASASHYLDYKTDKDVPAELKRDFYALSGLFYVADQHFEIFFRSREQTKELVTAELQSDRPNLEQEINLDNLTAYLQNRFPDRRKLDAKSMSELVQELTAAGYKTLKQIDDILDAAWNAFAAYEKDHPPLDMPQFAQVGVVRVAVDLWDDDFAQARRQSWKGLERDKYRKLLNIKPAK